jgi:hypothetical protein
MSSACFEISIDGKPWTYRDTKEAADAAVATLRTKHPNSHLLVRDLRVRSGLTLVPPPDGRPLANQALAPEENEPARKDRR